MMKEETIDRLRNIGLVGHGGTGKTTLNEAILFVAKGISRMGSVDDGTTVSDYSEDEKNRKISISLAISHLEWDGHKLNFIDMPGYTDFVGEVEAGLNVSDLALIVINGVSGIEVGTDTAWRNSSRLELPRGFFVNRMDKEHADFDKVVGQIQEAYGARAVPVTMAWGAGLTFKGVVDLISMKAYTHDKSGAAKEVPLPDDAKSNAESYREKIVEAAAEADDALLEKFFEAGELTPDELRDGLKKGIASAKIYPIFAGAASETAGIQAFLDFAVNFFPAPDYKGEKKGFLAAGENPATRKISPNESTSLYVFKTISEPHVGELSFFKVYSGKITTGDDLLNVNINSSERIGQIFAMKGKDRKEVGTTTAGDIGALVKLKSTHTGHTLADKKAPIWYKPAPIPNPVIRMAIKAKAKGDEEKIATGLARLREVDPSFKLEVDSEIKQTIVSGQGELHLAIITDRLKTNFGVEVELEKPKIPYRESIKSKAEAQGKYKKQTGGRGQYGDCWLRLEPLPRSTGFEFVDEVVGGVIPGKFIPSVEKGVTEALENGPLSGNRVVDLRVSVYYGSYHDVDSSDMAFKIAGSMGFKNAFAKADAYLLEPIYNIEVMIPEEYMGDVMGDISSRRGRIMGMERDGNMQKIKAQVPLAELYKYSTSLRSLTQGRGYHTMDFSHYEEVPREIAGKVIEEVKKEKEEEK
jgi:elongation factor G